VACTTLQPGRVPVPRRLCDGNGSRVANAHNTAGLRGSARRTLPCGNFEPAFPCSTEYLHGLPVDPLIAECLYLAIQLLPRWRN